MIAGFCRDVHHALPLFIVSREPGGSRLTSYETIS